MAENRLNYHTKMLVFGYRDFGGNLDKVRMQNVERFRSILEHILGIGNVRCADVRQTESYMFELDSPQRAHYRIYKDLIAWASCHPSAELLQCVAYSFMSPQAAGELDLIRAA